MFKHEELADPCSCWNKAGDNTFVFILIDMDEAMAATMRFWIGERIRLGLNKPGDFKLLCAEQKAEQVELLQAGRKHA